MSLLVKKTAFIETKPP